MRPDPVHSLSSPSSLFFLLTLAFSSTLNLCVTASVFNSGISFDFFLDFDSWLIRAFALTKLSCLCSHLPLVLWERLVNLSIDLSQGQVYFFLFSESFILPFLSVLMT